MKIDPRTRLLRAIAPLSKERRLAALESFEERIAIMIHDGEMREAEASEMAAAGVARAFGVELR